MSELKIPCKMCRERGQTWVGDSPKCAFEENVFSPRNWNCATVNAVRNLAEEQHVHKDDQNYSFIPYKGEEGGEDEFLYLSWYKSRGCTETMWLVTYGEPPRLPTEEDCLRILQQ
jgi:hypothetical protein